jgi:hypothetical protein
LASAGVKFQSQSPILSLFVWATLRQIWSGGINYSDNISNIPKPFRHAQEQNYGLFFSPRCRCHSRNNGPLIIRKFCRPRSTARFAALWMSHVLFRFGDILSLASRNVSDQLSELIYISGSLGVLWHTSNIACGESASKGASIPMDFKLTRAPPPA